MSGLIIPASLEELYLRWIRIKVGSYFLGKLLVIHPRTQLQAEPLVIRNIFITEFYYHLKGKILDSHRAFEEINVAYLVRKISEIIFRSW